MKKIGLLGGSFLVFGQEILVSILAFLSNIFVARWLGPVQLGFLYVVNLIPSYAEKLGRIGSFDDSAVYFIKNRKYSLPEVAGHLFTVSFLLSLLPIALFAVGRGYFETYFVKGAPIPASYLWTAICILPFSFLTLSSFKILLTQSQVVSYSLVQILKPALMLLLALFFWWRGWNFYGIILSMLIAGIIGFIVAFCFLLRTTPISFRWQGDLFRGMFQFGWKIYLTSTLTYLHQQADLALVAFFLTFKDVSYYGLVAGIAQLSWKIPNSISVLYFPHIAGEKTKSAVALTSGVCRMTLSAMLLCGAGIALTCGPVIHLLYGQAYAPLIKPLFCILPGVVAMGPAKVLYQHFVGQGHPLAPFRAVVASVPLNIGLDLYCIPRFGVVGAALVSSVTYTLYFLWLIGEFRHRWPIPLSDLLILKKEDISIVMKKISGFMGAPTAAADPS